MEASRANSVLVLSCISRSVVTSILASVVIFIHRVSSQFPGGQKPREHLNGLDNQSGPQEYYNLDTRGDFTSTTEILLYIRLGRLALECQPYQTHQLRRLSSSRISPCLQSIYSCCAILRRCHQIRVGRTPKHKWESSTITGIRSI